MKSHKRRRCEDSDAETALIEVARAFAEGVLRLHMQGDLPIGPNGLSIETALNTAQPDLEQSRETRLSVSGVNGPETPQLRSAKWDWTLIKRSHRCEA
jgi:hypothetical protein